MNKEKIKTKLTYFFSLSVICILLVLITYIFFLRTIEVDVMQGLDIQYTGENGMALAVCKNNTLDINQRTQDFLQSVTYTIAPNENLSNGDVVHVSASYDEQLASQYHFKPVHLEADIVVEGLNNRYDSLADIDKKYIDKVLKASLEYVESNVEQIFEINEQKEAEFIEAQSVYRVFMKSNSSKSSDRILVIYRLIYEYQDSRMALYYTVSVPEINDGMKVDKQDIFGEKAYLSDNEWQILDFDSYIQRVYGSQYNIERIE